MTEQPIEPRERDQEQNPETVSPQPDVDATREPEETAERYAEALSGSGVGSDTRAGSLRGGSASGSELDDDQARIDDMLTAEGMAPAEPRSFEGETDQIASQQAVNNVGQPNLGPHGDPAEDRRGVAAADGDDVDAATG